MQDRALKIVYCTPALYMAGGVECLTKGYADDWNNKNHDRRVCVIPNVFNLNNTRRFTDHSHNKVFFVGHLAKFKRIPYFIDIRKCVHALHPVWFLELYGDGEVMVKYAHTMSLQIINIHNPTRHIHDNYCNCSFFIQTSISESFSLLILEAKSCVLPVVAFNCPYGPRDIITDGKDGFLFRQFGVNIFVEKVICLIENKDFRMLMGRSVSVHSLRFASELIMPK